MLAERIQRVEARAFTVPTDQPEADGTYAWTATTLLVVRIDGQGVSGLGYSYTHACAAELIRATLAPLLVGRDIRDIPGAITALIAGVRNLGACGIAAAAIAALDIALWDAKCQVIGLPLVALLGACRDRVPVYGSGGFTSYSDQRLAEQLSGWATSGMRMVKMKVGSDPARDPSRVQTARSAIGRQCELFVDANGAYAPQQALALATCFHESGVTWFEEPVPSQDARRMRFLREHLPAGMELAGGEYEYQLADAQRLLDAQAVDVLQADATRCLGISGFLATAALCQARGVPLSTHCAPSLHVHLGCALPAVRHLEWFHDHVRIEGLLFDGAPVVQDGTVAADRARPGLGLALKTTDAEVYAA